MSLSTPVNTRKTFCSRGSSSTSSIHNGSFFTNTPLIVGDLVKIQSDQPQYVTKFSPDYVITDVNQFDKTTLIDILTKDDIIYILGLKSVATDTTYFLSTYPLNASQGSSTYNNWTSYLPLGLSTPLSLNTVLGNICIFNQYIYVLVHGHPSGFLYTISQKSLKLLASRKLFIYEHFMLFGGVEEVRPTNREESLFLLNGKTLSRINPSASNSWTSSLQNDAVSACTLTNMVIVLFSHEITAFDSNSGNTLWTISLGSDIIGTCSIGVMENLSIGRLYITTVVNSSTTKDNIVTVIQAMATRSGINIISRHQIPTRQAPKLSCISSWYTNDTSGYILWTNSQIFIMTNDNVLISRIMFTEIDVDRTYRIIPRHNYDIIPVIINGVNDIYVNGLSTYSGKTFYGGFLMLRTAFPQRAGIVTDIVENNKVYVAMTGVITNVLQNLTPNRTYLVDKKGQLTDRYHNDCECADYIIGPLRSQVLSGLTLVESRPFIIIGREPNSASIIYNKI